MTSIKAKLKRIGNHVQQYFKIFLQLLLFLYQSCISPFLPRSCIFKPTCSCYAQGVLKKYTLPKALYLIIKRLVRCNPFSRGGRDPV